MINRLPSSAPPTAQTTETAQTTHAIHVTADTLADRFKVAVAQEFGDRNLYRAGAGLAVPPSRK
ncbi:hypothetical protein ACLMNJ_01250 [Streptomyces seoulensis]